MSDLQTWDEFVKNKNAAIVSRNYEKTNVACPKCGKPLYVNTLVTLACLPPKKEYVCFGEDCDWYGYA